MAEIRYPTPMDVVALNERVLGRSGALVDEGRLISALHRAEAAAYYEGADTIQQSVILLTAVALTHAFADGNKRTALYAVAVFWQLNGWAFTGDLLDLARRLERLVANHQEREAEGEALVAWLRERVRLG